MLGITFFTSNTLLIVVSPTEKVYFLYYVVDVELRFEVGLKVKRSIDRSYCSRLAGCLPLDSSHLIADWRIGEIAIAIAKS